MRTVLSHEPVTSLRTGEAEEEASEEAEPRAVKGAQETALQPIESFTNEVCVHESLRYSMIVILPSEDAAARTRPTSCAAHAIELTEASYIFSSKTLFH